MSDRPIIFRGAMVRALLDGRKTQTRRLVSIIEAGDRLWVREAWAYYGGDEYLYQRSPSAVSYRADAWDPLAPVPGGRWRPSIHMPRWASRLTLDVTGVCVQRLQDITEADAKAEGVRAPVNVSPDLGSTHVDGFGDLWEEIHGAGAWDANPWVVAITFAVERRNIDEVAR